MDGSIIFLLIAIVVVGILVFVIISMTQKRGYAFSKEKYQSKWLKIEKSLEQGKPATYNAAVMEADKLLDHAMTEMGIRGKTMGERLKKGGGRFTHLNAVWAAHKARNQIAHEVDYQISYDQAQRALRAYRSALKDLGAI